MLHRITVDLRPGEGGPEVGNLQDGLLALIDHGLIHSLDAPMSPTASELARPRQQNSQPACLMRQCDTPAPRKPYA
jgi:hypothetical protein